MICAYHDVVCEPVCGSDKQGNSAWCFWDVRICMTRLAKRVLNVLRFSVLQSAVNSELSVWREDVGLFLGFSHRSLKDVVFIYLTECFVSRFNAIFYLNCYVEDEEVSMVVSFFLINAIFESLLHLNDYRCTQHNCIRWRDADLSSEGITE